MLLFECFYDRNRYISPEDEIKIYYETINLMDSWRNILVKYSNYNLDSLIPELKQVTQGLIKKLPNINFNHNKTIGPQLDRQIVEIILWSVSEVFPNKDIINEITNKTKSGANIYFHQDLLINAYLRLNDPQSALNLIKHIYKDHPAYLYAILKYDLTKYDNTEFIEGVRQLQKSAIIKLLSIGERVNLLEVNYTDLLNIVKAVEGVKK